MKKIILCFLSFVVALCLIGTAFADGPFVYTDVNTNTSFTVPEDWDQKDMSKPRKFIDAKFVSTIDNRFEIIYTSEDIYGDPSAQNEFGSSISREDINNSLFTKADFADIFGCDKSDVSMITYGGVEYFFAETSASVNLYGVDISIPMVYLARCCNGNFYMFQFSGKTDSPYYDDFECLVSSVNYPHDDQNSSGQKTFSFVNILFSFIITVTIYSMPIIIYRYLILKHPLPEKEAKKVTIIYGIIAFFIMFAVAFCVNGVGSVGGAIILWSWVNYRMLIGGKSTIQEKNFEKLSECGKSDIIDQDNSECNQIMYCPNCGAKLSLENNFCNKCGIKIKKEE